MGSSRERMERRRFRSRRAIRRSGAERLRLSIFRSNQHIYAQIIDDKAGQTVASASTVDGEMKSAAAELKGADRARRVGTLLGERATGAGVEFVKFDRGPYRYHGLVKALAEGAREAGLKF